MRFGKRLILRRLVPWWRRFRRNGYRPERCEECGHRFHWKRDARHSFGNRDGKVWHGPCMSLVVMRGKAEDRLEVLGVMVELTGVTGADVRATMSLRDTSGQPGSGSNGWNLAWRVFYDLENSRTKGRP